MGALDFQPKAALNPELFTPCVQPQPTSLKLNRDKYKINDAYIFSNGGPHSVEGLSSLDNNPAFEVRRSGKCLTTGSAVYDASSKHGINAGPVTVVARVETNDDAFDGSFDFRVLVYGDSTSANYGLRIDFNNSSASQSQLRVRTNSGTYSVVDTTNLWPEGEGGWLLASHDETTLYLWAIVDDGTIISDSVAAAAARSDNSAWTITLGGDANASDMLDGAIGSVFFLNEAITNSAKAFEILRNPYGELLTTDHWPSVFVPPAGGPITVVTGLATETDTAFAVTPQRAKTVGLSTETDSALVTTPQRTYLVGQAQETNTSFSVGIVKTVNVDCQPKPIRPYRRQY